MITWPDCFASVASYTPQSSSPVDVVLIVTEMATVLGQRTRQEDSARPIAVCDLSPLKWKHSSTKLSETTSLLGIVVAAVQGLFIKMKLNSVNKAALQLLLDWNMRRQVQLLWWLTTQRMAHRISFQRKTRLLCGVFCCSWNYVNEMIEIEWQQVH